MKETALLFETRGYRDLDYTITVFAPKEVRIDRVLKRDQTTRAAILDRMSKQMNEEKKIEFADFVIHNDGEQLIIPQVRALYQQLVELAQKE